MDPIAQAADAARFDEMVAKRLDEIERSFVSDDALDAALADLNRRPATNGARGRPSLRTPSRITALVALLERAIPQTVAADLGRNLARGAAPVGERRG